MTKDDCGYKWANYIKTGNTYVWLNRYLADNNRENYTIKDLKD